MSVRAKISSRLDVVETLTDALATRDNTVTFDGASSERTIHATSTPAATKVAAFTKALTAGAATIDLTTLVGTNGAAVNATGLKLQAAKFINPSTNANAITIEAGASTGYDIFGASGLVVLAPGQEILFFGNEATVEVSASLKDIDISGTGTQALTCVLVFG